MTATSEPLRLACAADPRNALPLAVMLRSAIDTVGDGLRIVVHAVSDGLDAADREHIERALDQRAAIVWAAPVVVARDQIPQWGRMPATVYQKLTLADWLPLEASRALWLDCDVLVRRDLAPLWHAQLGDRVVAAAQDELVPFVSSRFGIARYRALGLAKEDKYFNAGVLLVDLDRWRREEIARRTFEYLRRFRDEIVFWDQEALNAVLAGRWLELDGRWNRNASLRRIAPARSRGEAWILHYCGRLKPWLYPGLDVEQEEFFRHLDATEWRGTRPPRGLRDRALSLYARSPLRRALLPAEQWAVAISHAVGRRSG